jgi:ribosomal protein S18 acetylase RimI-like enzyme
VKVVTAGSSDVSDLSAIGTQVFWDAYGGTAPDADIERHVLDYFGEETVAREIVSPGVTYLKACEGDKLAGLVKLRDSDVPELLRGHSAVEVQQLYVSVDFQRRGIGALLLDTAKNDVRGRNIDGIWLSVWSEADWATRFYIKYGFQNMGEIPFMLADVEYIDYLMWLSLSD